MSRRQVAAQRRFPARRNETQRHRVAAERRNPTVPRRGVRTRTTPSARIALIQSFQCIHEARPSETICYRIALACAWSISCGGVLIGFRKALKHVPAKWNPVRKGEPLFAGWGTCARNVESTAFSVSCGIVVPYDGKRRQTNSERRAAPSIFTRGTDMHHDLPDVGAVEFAEIDGLRVRYAPIRGSDQAFLYCSPVHGLKASTRFVACFPCLGGGIR